MPRVGVLAMGDSKHYDTHLARPAKGSRYEYFVSGFSILETEGVPPVWAEPVEPPPGLCQRDARAWARHNRITAGYAETRARMAAEALESIGISPDRHSEPAVQSVIRSLEIGYMLQSEIAESRMGDWDGVLGWGGNEPPKEGRYPKAVCQRVIAAADIALGLPGPTAIATFLNEGTRHGLEPDHIRRALKAGIPKTVKPGIGAELWWARVSASMKTLPRKFNALQLVASRAKNEPDLRRLRGAALAETIHERYDLAECVERAMRELHPHEFIA